jgi:F-type H+-transporting ATPase subunit epsilon
MLSVTVTCPEGVLFDGPAERVILPGEQGTFEVLPLHRPLISRLVRGWIEINEGVVPIRRGVVRVADDTVTAVVEVDQ